MSAEVETFRGETQEYFRGIESLALPRKHSGLGCSLDFARLRSE